MFGLSFSELAVAGLVAFVLFGPEQFPVMVRQAIKGISEFKKFVYEAQMSVRDFTQDIEKELNPLAKGINAEFDPKNWTSTLSPKGIKSSSGSVSVERIRLDQNSEHYTTVIDWKQTVTLDRDPSHYVEIYTHSPRKVPPSGLNS